MSAAIDISPWMLALGYLLLLIPLGLMLALRARLLKKSVAALLRMTVQLVFVGFYLQVIFDLDRWWLNALWLLVMIAVADLSIISGSDLAFRRFLAPVGTSLFAGTLVPLVFFNWIILQLPGIFDAQYFIPIGGMIMGNCLRADIIGIRTFFQSVRNSRKAYFYALAQGASLAEAQRPFFRSAFESALAPTVATMATIGLVSLPGMMTGIIMGGADPATAIKYQIGIMIAIFTGTAMTVYAAITITARTSFTEYGTLKSGLFKEDRRKDKKYRGKNKRSET